MKDLFLQGFNEDLEKLEKIIKTERDKRVNNVESMRIHDEFWNSLNKEQKEKFRAFEIVLGEEALISQENTYLFALKKGFAMGYEISKEFN